MCAYITTVLLMERIILTCMKMKPNALRRTRRRLNNPQSDRVASTAIKIDYSCFFAEHRCLESVGAVEACVSVMLWCFELIPASLLLVLKTCIGENELLVRAKT